MNVDDLRVFPTLVNGLVFFDEIVGFAGLRINVVSAKFNCSHDVFVLAA
jgi:hypothetical protein